MCENYKPCSNTIGFPPRRKMTVLLLDCWQREYDKRPYRHFSFKSLDFQKRLERNYHRIDDFAVIVQFLSTRSLSSVQLIGFSLPSTRNDLVQNFVHSLWKLRRIELRLMYLPTIFFKLLYDNVAAMNLRELILEGSKLMTADIKSLRLFVSESKILTHLNVARCDVTQFDFALLADGVHKSNSLRSFNCSHLLGAQLSLDTTKTAHIISSLIWQNKLEELESQSCELHGNDMEILCEYMEHSKSKLRKLNLACNSMGSDGAEYLFRAIVRSNTLTHLDISRNGLGSPGGLVVAHNLSSCYYLEYLNISHNKIGADVMYLIMSTISKPIPLRLLKVWGNVFDNKTAKVLRRVLGARVVMQESIDVKAVYDESLSDFRVIPYY